MAQSSDRNDYNRNNNSGSMQAEQILDSIIEHIEATDEPATGGAAQSAELSRDGRNIDGREGDSSYLAQDQAVAPAIKSDLNDIERRAAQLASRLGGDGLSFNAGVKKHLDTAVATSSGTDERQGSSIVPATIHEADREVDNRRFGLSGDETSNAARSSDTEAARHDLHVSAWEEELQTKNNFELATPALEPVKVDLAHLDKSLTVGERPVEGRSDASFDSVADKIVTQLESSRDQNPDLHEIESKIEALSSSMKEHADPAITPSKGQAETSQVEKAPARKESAADLAQRVDSLEKHIVRLLDDLSLSEQKLSNLVSEDIRSQTQETVLNLFEDSEIFGAMKAELEQAAEQRLLQDVRMSDSLDALHDALKDIGERVNLIETVAKSEPQGTPVELPSTGGIVSSVLGAGIVVADQPSLVSAPSPSALSTTAPSITEFANKAHEEEVPALSDEAEPGDDLPTWLSDATQDLHDVDTGIQEQPADIFASNPGQLERGAQQARAEEKPEKPSQEEPRQEFPEPEGSRNAVVDDLVVSSYIDRHSAQKTVDDKKENTGRSGEFDYMSDEGIDREELEEVPTAENDFLHSARAAAQAANDRTHVNASKVDDNVASGDAEVKNSSFIAAAKQKDAGAEEGPLAMRSKSAPKNSLFSDKVQGPNSLLVFTSLVLFGTSALLLYGMANSHVEDGSIVKLNAVEKAPGHQTASPNPGSSGQSTGKSKPLTKQQTPNSSAINRPTKQLPAGDRSKLQTPDAVAGVVRPALEKQADGISALEAKRTSRVEPVGSGPTDIEFTASIPQSGKGAGSLFDQYIGFSSLSGGEATVDAPAKKPGIQENKPHASNGVSGLLSSASKGDVLAQYEVARRYGKGIGVKRSPAISVEWYEKSAKAGYAPAIYRLATMYERGNGVQKDYKRAMELYTLAANIGNVKAMHNLAVLYTGGNLGKADYSNAIIWYRKAAEYGVKDSQFNLAIIYQNGMSGDLDLEEAYKWYSLAARAGDNEAKELVKDLREELTREQQAKLEKMISNWKAKTPDKNSNVVSKSRRAGLQNGSQDKS